MGMKEAIEKRKAAGLADYVALTLTTFGVGYIPGAPGTYGSAIGVVIYLIFGWLETPAAAQGSGAGFNLALVFFLFFAFHYALNLILLAIFCLLGIWASGRTNSIFGNEDPSEGVVD